MSSTGSVGKCVGVDDKVVHELSALFRKKGDKILGKQMKLTLTLCTLISLNRSLRRLQDENTFDEIVILSTSETQTVSAVEHHDSDLKFLEDFLQKILILKITPGKGTVQGSVQLSHFSSLRVLELRHVPIHLFVGLQQLRPHLKVVSCMRCSHSLEDFFSSCGGDRSAPFSWSELVSATLKYSNIEYIGSSLRLLPSVVFLDLSHNKILETHGLEYLTELEYLNLSYNNLNCIPTLGTRARSRLKSLAIRNNELESLDGLELFSNLQQIDAAFNCLINHCSLSPMLYLQDLKLVCLEGNPIACHTHHRLLTVEHLHDSSLIAMCVVDGQNITRMEIMLMRKSQSGCRTWKHCSVESRANHSINAVAERSNLFSLVDTDLRSCVSDTGVVDLASSGEFSNVQITKPLSNKRKPQRSSCVREVLISEDSEISRKTNVPNDDGRAQLTILKEVVSAELSAEQQEDLVEAKDKVERFKEQHGSEWLIIGSRMNLLTPANDLNDSEEIFLSHDDSVTGKEERKHRDSEVSDDVIILNSDPAALSDQGLLDGKWPWQKNVEQDDDNSDDDNDAVLPPFIVQMEKPGFDSSLTVLLVVTNHDLREKDALTGRTVERLDLRSICSINPVMSLVATQCSPDVDGPRIRIVFSYVRKDRRERIYTFEDTESHNQFVTFLKPLVDIKTLHEMLGALQCLKCSAQFSKDVASKVIRRSRLPLNDKLLTSGPNVSRDILSEVNACPNCSSELLVECQMTPQLSSTPVAGWLPCQKSDSGNISSSVYNLKSSCLESVFKPLSCSSTAEYASDGPVNCCNMVEVKVDVHSQVHPERCQSEPRVFLYATDSTNAETLKRSGSDITILSNPSQSSIMVMPNPNTDYSLDAISECSTDIPKITISQVLHNQSKFAEKGNIQLHLESASSDSLTDSTGTAVEKNVYDCSLSPTPESFLSATSGEYSTSTVQPSSLCTASQFTPNTGVSIENLNVHEESIEPGIDVDSSTPLISKGPSSYVNLMSSDVEYCHGDRILTWSQRDSQIEYSYSDFGKIDHRLQLYLAMEVFDDSEESVFLLRTCVIPYLKSKEFPGLLVITWTKVHILKITGSENDQPQTWLQKYESHSLDMLLHLNIRLGNQAFQLEFGPKQSPCCYTFVLRDADHCNSFVTQLFEKLKPILFDRPESQFQSGLDGDETLQTIQEYLLQWQPSEYFKSHDDDNRDELSLTLYLMCYWIPEGKKSYEPISVVMTSQDVYFFVEDLHWPLPHLTLPPNEVLGRPQLLPLERKRIQDLTSLEQIENYPLELTLMFLDENSQKETCVKIATETTESLKSVVQALKDPWEKLFNVELQVIMKND